MGHNIEMCLVKWPSFEDIDEVLSEHAAVVVNPRRDGFRLRLSQYPESAQIEVGHRSQGRRLDRYPGTMTTSPP